MRDSVSAIKAEISVGRGTGSGTATQEFGFCSHTPEIPVKTQAQRDELEELIVKAEATYWKTIARWQDRLSETRAEASAAYDALAEAAASTSSLDILDGWALDRWERATARTEAITSLLDLLMRESEGHIRAQVRKWKGIEE